MRAFFPNIITVGPLTGFGCEIIGTAPDIANSPYSNGELKLSSTFTGAAEDLPSHLKFARVCHRSDGGAPNGTGKAVGYQLSRNSLLCVIEKALFNVVCLMSGDDEIEKLDDNRQATTINGVKISIDVPAELELPPRQAITFSKLIQELLKNAIKYSDPNKENRFVKIYWSGNKLIIEDNGIGIKDVAKAWMSGYGEHSDTRGTGLGLSIIADRITELGWDITLSSEKGVGTVFAVKPTGVLKNNTFAEGFATVWKAEQDISLTNLALEYILKYIEQAHGKIRSEIVVTVPGFGQNHIELKAWLSLGVKVQAVTHGVDLNIFDDDLLKMAKSQGRLATYEIGEVVPPADVVIWTYPGAYPGEYYNETSRKNLTAPIGLQELTAYKGKILIVQSEIERYFEGLGNFWGFVPLIPLTRADAHHYLFPSPLSILDGTLPVNIGIYRRLTTNSNVQDGIGEIKSDRFSADDFADTPPVHPITGKPFKADSLDDKTIKALINEVRLYFKGKIEGILKRYKMGVNRIELKHEILRDDSEQLVLLRRMRNLLKLFANQRSMADGADTVLAHRYLRYFSFYSAIGSLLSDRLKMQKLLETGPRYNVPVMTLLREICALLWHIARAKGVEMNYNVLETPLLDNDSSMNFEELEEVLESLVKAALEQSKERVDISWDNLENAIVIVANGGTVASEILAVINRASAQGWRLSYETMPNRTEFHLKFPLIMY